MSGLPLTLLVLLVLHSAASALPDLTPEIYDIEVVTDSSVSSGDVAEGCAAATDGLTLVRFGLLAHNVGPDPLVRGDPGCPDCEQYPGFVCTNPQFICSPAGGHGHPHFDGFARYELLDLAGHLVALGAKRSFCMQDSFCTGPGPPTFDDCDTNQGVSPGCADDYSPDLGCQYIDVTGAGVDLRRAFRVRVTLDPQTVLEDADRTNNVAEAIVAGCGDGALQDGEECDAGAAAGACCTAECRLAALGTPCRGAADACDAPEMCAGSSPTCPADARLPDGASCASASSPCSEASCTGGACVVRATVEGCTIDGTCVAAGAAAPGDSCRRCDPEQDPGGWSPNVDPDPTGLRCQAERIATNAAGLRCRPGLASSIAGRVGGARRMLERLLVAPSLRRQARLVQRLDRLSHLLDGRARRRGCRTEALSAEVQRLLEQLRGFAVVGAANSTTGLTPPARLPSAFRAEHPEWSTW